MKKSIFLIIASLMVFSFQPQASPEGNRHPDSVNDEVSSQPFRVAVKDSDGKILPHAKVAIEYNGGTSFASGETDQEGECLLKAPSSSKIIVRVNGVNSGSFYTSPATPSGFSETASAVSVTFTNKPASMAINFHSSALQEFLVTVVSGQHQGLSEKIKSDARGNLLITGDQFASGKIQEDDTIQVKLIGSNRAWKLKYNSGQRYELSSASKNKI